MYETSEINEFSEISGPREPLKNAERVKVEGSMVTWLKHLLPWHCASFCAAYPLHI